MIKSVDYSWIDACRKRAVIKDSFVSDGSIHYYMSVGKNINGNMHIET